MRYIGEDPKKLHEKRVVNHRRKKNIGYEERGLVKGRTGRISRHRIKWRNTEDEILIKAKKENKPISNIQHLLKSRTLSDIYCRWRILLKKFPSLKEIQSEKMKERRNELKKLRSQNINCTNNEKSNYIPEEMIAMWSRDEFDEFL